MSCSYSEVVEIVTLDGQDVLRKFYVHDLIAEAPPFGDRADWVHVLGRGWVRKTNLRSVA